MSLRQKSIVLGAFQVVIVLSLGAKLLYDRFTRPRGWALTQGYDPELPIRGRYLTQRLVMPATGFTGSKSNTGWGNRQWATFDVLDETVYAKAPRGDGTDSGGAWVYLQDRGNSSMAAVTEEPVLLFIPERADVPPLKPGEERWIEVTVPKKGPPRPIRLGLKKDGKLTPMAVE